MDGMKDIINHWSTGKANICWHRFFTGDHLQHTYNIICSVAIHRYSRWQHHSFDFGQNYLPKNEAANDATGMNLTLLNPLRLQYVILRTQFQSRCDYDT